MWCPMALYSEWNALTTIAILMRDCIIREIVRHTRLLRIYALSIFILANSGIYFLTNVNDAGV